MKLKKVVKLTGYTYACNSMTNFEYEAHSMTGNGNKVNVLKLREITTSDLNFGGFELFGTTVSHTSKVCTRGSM